MTTTNFSQQSFDQWLTTMSPTEAQEFVKLFSERYILKRGFGNMTKKDFEVMFFDIFRQIWPGSFDCSNFEWSTNLRIPETKIRSLAYDADLAYHPYSPKELRDKFFTILKQNIAKFSNDGKKLQFVIEDRSLRTMLSADLKRLGYFADTSFNSEIVSVELRAFGDLLLEYYPKEFKDEIYKQCQNQLRGKKESQIDWTLIMQKFLEGLAKGTGEAILLAIKDIAMGYFNTITIVGKVADVIGKLIKDGIDIYK